LSASRLNHSSRLERTTGAVKQTATVTDGPLVR
jgi:hypothetical protein